MVLLALLVGCAAPAPATHTVRGVLVDVQSRSLQQLDSFTVRTDDGQELTFSPAPNFNANESHAMNPGHMRQHMALADPVTVTYREEDQRLVALSATD
ncbi:MAG TPA: hypothetical protein VFA49_04645 [Chloroflexota bacterium]|nr:hypothetical protein [Chloroflexota bacterium]